MVNFPPPRSVQNSRTRSALGRSFRVASLLACCAIAGCQQSSRFAQGEGQMPVSYRPAGPTAKTEPAPALPPGYEPKDIPDIPRGPAGLGIASKFPATWSPRGANRPWKWIVVHHSATPDGGAGRFHKEHRDNGWDELGYHFVIGNGTDTRDGIVEVGPRWLKQKHGAHAKTDDNRFNDFGIGICLVGNFDNGRPSPQQLKSLATLVAFLMQRYEIPENRVIGHDDTGKNTACPGHNLEAQLPGVRRLAARAVANGFAATEQKADTATFASDRR